MLRFYEVDRPSFIELANIALVQVDPSTVPDKDKEMYIQMPNKEKMIHPKINPNAI
jgi:hypothetical protein